MQYDDLSGKIALVTGVSREQSIGAAICRMLASQGVHIVFTSWGAHDLERGYDGVKGFTDNLLAELHALDVQAAHLEIDFSSEDAALRVLDFATEQIGYPHILVNNAAYSTNGDYTAIDGAQLDAHYRVNLRTPLLLTALFVRGFPHESGGRIINMTSGQGLGAMPNELAYVATKGAIDALTVTLAAEVAHKHITVNAVDPGGTDTGWMDDAIRADMLQHSAMGRLSMPQDTARLITFLASDAAQWITGQIIRSRGA